MSTYKFRAEHYCPLAPVLAPHALAVGRKLGSLFLLDWDFKKRGAFRGVACGQFV